MTDVTVDAEEVAPETVSAPEPDAAPLAPAIPEPAPAEAPFQPSPLPSVEKFVAEFLAIAAITHYGERRAALIAMCRNETEIKRMFSICNAHLTLQEEMAGVDVSAERQALAEIKAWMCL